MKSNVISICLTAYALWSAIANRNKLDTQLERIVDLENSQSELESEVTNLAKTTYTLLDKDLSLEYWFVTGRPTSMTKLAGMLTCQLTNKSQKNTYILKALQFTPIIGTTFANKSGEKLFNLYWKNGVRLEPGESKLFHICWNNMKLDSETFGIVYDKLTDMFCQAAGWQKLGDKYYTIENGCKTDLWILANAPYVDAVHDVLIQRKNVSGGIMWHGGNFLPGNTRSGDSAFNMGATVLNFNEAKQVFGA